MDLSRLGRTGAKAILDHKEELDKLEVRKAILEHKEELDKLLRRKTEAEKQLHHVAEEIADFRIEGANIATRQAAAVQEIEAMREALCPWIGFTLLNQ
ncbi:hypothetical protein T484DRAFT_1769637 [Baffinella frigidus]|nr:hypothetical protein T484DRAFT_1769637 [Cryptophyta sp. CCMP2293]